MDDILVETTETIIITVIPNNYDVDEQKDSITLSIASSDTPNITLQTIFEVPGTPIFEFALGNVQDRTSFFGFEFNMSSSTLTLGSDIFLTPGDGVVSIATVGNRSKRSTDVTLLITVDLSFGTDQGYVFEVRTSLAIPYSSAANAQTLIVSVEGQNPISINVYKEQPLTPVPTDQVDVPPVSKQSPASPLSISRSNSNDDDSSDDRTESQDNNNVSPSSDEATSLVITHLFGAFVFLLVSLFAAA